MPKALQQHPKMIIGLGLVTLSLLTTFHFLLPIGLAITASNSMLTATVGPIMKNMNHWIKSGFNRLHSWTKQLWHRLVACYDELSPINQKLLGLVGIIAFLFVGYHVTATLMMQLFALPIHHTGWQLMGAIASCAGIVINVTAVTVASILMFEDWGLDWGQISTSDVCYMITAATICAVIFVTLTPATLLGTIIATPLAMILHASTPTTNTQVQAGRRAMNSGMVDGGNDTMVSSSRTTTSKLESKDSLQPTGQPTG